MANLLNLIEGKSESKTKDNFFISSWLSLMHAVNSWVPFDEYKSMSCDLIIDLLKEASQRQKEQTKDFKSKIKK